MMSKEIMIGRKVTRKNMIKNIFGSCFIALIGVWVCFSIFHYMEDYIAVSVNSGVRFLIIFLVFVIPLVFLYLPLVSAERYLIIENNILNYVAPSSYIDKMQQFIIILKGEERNSNIAIPIVNIKYVYITYYKMLSVYAQAAYIPIINLSLYDGTMISFEKISDTPTIQQYADLLDYLEEQRVTVVDKHQMRQYLRSKTYHEDMNAVDKKMWERK